MSTFLVGVITGLGLIVAIGAQNAYVLRQGIRRQSVGLVVAVCIVSDVLLIAAGAGGLGALVSGRPGVLRVVTLAGAAYLVWFAVGCLRSAWRPRGLQAQHAPSDGSRPRTVLTTALALTWLNPHVYLDTVVLLGSVAASHGPGRWTFAGGAMVASVAWFALLGYGARALAGPLSRPGTWRVVDGVIGLTMLALAARLALA